MALFVASVIFILWLTGLTVDLESTLHGASPVATGLLICTQTFLHTGLFITAHEAMHGNISVNRTVNRTVGQMALWLYAGLDYQRLLANHHQHHRYPATAQDPDFCHYPDSRFWPWYFGFMQRYQSGKQLGRFLVWLAIFFLILKLGSLPLSAFFYFGLLPLTLSSLQLFTFGIFLPHRPSPDGSLNLHRAKSSNWPVLLSFVSCYHFGYHWEHHQYPNISWYDLPKVKAQLPQTKSGLAQRDHT